MTEILNKYAIIDPYQINDFHKKGYEFVTVFYETWQNNSGQVSLSGSIMNTGANLNGNVPIMESNPKFLMVLNSTGEVLFGTK